MPRSRFRKPRLAAALLATALLVGSSLPSVANENPNGILEQIFEKVQASCKEGAEAEPYDVGEIAKEFFAPDLAAKFEKATEDGALDFDVLTDAQDCAVTDLELSVPEEDEDNAVARATFENMGEPRTIDLSLSKAGGDWKIVDIVYGHRKFSLGQQLE